MTDAYTRTRETNLQRGREELAAAEEKLRSALVYLEASGVDYEAAVVALAALQAAARAFRK